MTASDWILDTVLILIVFRQLREERLSVRTILLPLGIIGWAASSYLHNIPTAGNDLALIAGFTAIGALFGVLSGLLSRVRYADGHVYLKATASSAAIWVASMGLRMAFAVWTSHRSGAAHVASFSAAHHITSSEAWVAALILMAFGEVVLRLGTIVIRGQLQTARHGRTTLAAKSDFNGLADRSTQQASRTDLYV